MENAYCAKTVPGLFHKHLIPDKLIILFLRELFKINVCVQIFVRKHLLKIKAQQKFQVFQSADQDIIHQCRSELTTGRHSLKTQRTSREF